MAIVGSRNCKNLDLDEIIRRVPAGTTEIISGGAAGIDQLAAQAAKMLEIPFREILPDYRQYGKSAPIYRNQELVAQSERVLAFWDQTSRGTASTISICIEKQIPVEIFNIDA